MFSPHLLCIHQQSHTHTCLLRVNVSGKQVHENMARMVCGRFFFRCYCCCCYFCYCHTYTLKLNEHKRFLFIAPSLCVLRLVHICWINVNVCAHFLSLSLLALARPFLAKSVPTNVYSMTNLGAFPWLFVHVLQGFPWCCISPVSVYRLSCAPR